MRNRGWIIAALAMACKAPGVAEQPAGPPAARASDPPAELAAVEHGLLPPIVLAGVDLRMTVAQRLPHHKVPAIGVAVIDHGAVHWARTWGVLEAGKPIAADAETRFQAASISKPVTAVAVLRLIEQNRLELDADVNRYLRSWKLPARAAPVTIRQLLSHTAGLNAPEQTAYFRPDQTFAGYPRGAPLPTTTQILNGGTPAISEPVRFLDGWTGGFRYSGGGYMVLQQVIEDVTGTPFAAAMRALVLEPVGMTHSTFEPEPGTDNVARAHTAAGEPVAGGWIVVAEKSIGGLWTTPRDLALLVTHLMAASNGETGRVLKPETVKLMLTPIANARPMLSASIGLGMFVSDDAGDVVFSHNGHNPGFHATIAAVPASGRGMVVMINREAGGAVAGEMMFAIGAVYDWPARTGVRARSRALFDVAPAVVAAAAGTYQGFGFRVTVRADAAKLFATVDDRPELRLYPIGASEFVDPYSGLVFGFAIDGDRARQLTIDGKHEAARVE